ncbi:MAG TPA: nucleotide sugar dehydrogenase [Propionibacteriaceae bacterium]|nr:nucleotide sugar dehydrogenase [Propionibacteriaceae bacterium]
MSFYALTLRILISGQILGCLSYECAVSGKVIIVGQGYVGLPVAMRAVEVGYSVVGLDTDKRRVSELAAGSSYVGDVSSAVLSQALASGRYLPSTTYHDAAEFDIAVITVPTPLRETLPDLSYIEDSAMRLGRHLRQGATVVLESTTYPGTTEELVVPILEKASGLCAGQDFFVGYSPERIDPGNPTHGFVTTPKVVSGINASSLRRVQDFYNSLVTSTVAVSTPKEAELTKLLENTFRHVNIALVNELAVFAHQLGIDIWESIEAASTKPFGYMKFTPGPGVGGHCLPVDPSYLSWQVRRQLGQNFRFVELANDINEHMPHYVMQRITGLLNDHKKAINGSTVLLVGLAYKKNTGDIREAPAVKLIQLLRELGAVIQGADPHVERYRWPEGVEEVTLSAATLKQVDVAVLLTDHDSFELSVLADSETPLLDTRRRVDGPQVSPL